MGDRDNIDIFELFIVHMPHWRKNPQRGMMACNRDMAERSKKIKPSEKKLNECLTQFILPSV